MSISISAWNRVILKSRIIFLAFLTLARLPLAPYMIFCYCPCNLCQSEFSVGNVILILVMHHRFFFPNPIAGLECKDHTCATPSQCLKITGKVAFKIASEASYLYIESGQKLIKNAKNGQFGFFS